LCAASEGAALHPLKASAIDAVFHKGQNPAIDSYSAFFDQRASAKTDFMTGCVNAESQCVHD
jgi:nicotinamidase-related amidase